MQILLACAKIMSDSTSTAVPMLTKPHFADEAARFALDMMQFSVPEISQMLKCSATIAAENLNRYMQFFEESQHLPAILAYNGQAYKGLNANTFTDHDFCFAQKHLYITSFLYGLLRPLDNIHPYRMEGKVSLPSSDGLNMFNHWKPLLTQHLIDSVKADDGILVHLATEEMQHLFNWKDVTKQVTVIQPQFLVNKCNKLHTVTVYAKTCRGAMTRHIIKNRCSTAEQLLDFAYDGFAYDPNYGDSLNPHFILNEHF
jgi:cytoplasmic iron level regulating protein YaaA (DUF328/UPF0246 family)